MVNGWYLCLDMGNAVAKLLQRFKMKNRIRRKQTQFRMELLSRCLFAANIRSRAHWPIDHLKQLNYLSGFFDRRPERFTSSQTSLSASCQNSREMASWWWSRSTAMKSGWIIAMATISINLIFERSDLADPLILGGLGTREIHMARAWSVFDRMPCTVNICGRAKQQDKNSVDCQRTNGGLHSRCKRNERTHLKFNRNEISLGGMAIMKITVLHSLPHSITLQHNETHAKQNKMRFLCELHEKVYGYNCAWVDRSVLLRLNCFCLLWNFWAKDDCFIFIRVHFVKLNESCENGRLGGKLTRNWTLTNEWRLSVGSCCVAVDLLSIAFARFTTWFDVISLRSNGSLLRIDRSVLIWFWESRLITTGSDPKSDKNWTINQPSDRL